MNSPIGVTSFIKKFKPPFDKEAVSAKVASKRNTTKEAVLKEWGDKRDLSIKRGDFLHGWAVKVLEARKSSSDLPPLEVSGVVKQEALGIVRFVDYMYGLGWEAGYIEHEIKTETLVGAIDVVWANHDKKEAVIQDWKTSIADKEFNKMLPPVSHLFDNSRTSAALQLETYRRMALKLELLPPNYNIKTAIALIDRRQTSWVSTPQLRKEVAAMLTVHTQSKQLPKD